MLPSVVRMSDEFLSSAIAALGRLEQRVDDATRIDRIRLLEELKAAAAAAQAKETAAFAASQRAAQAAAGVPKTQLGRGVATQVGLARRISPHAAARYVGWASILTRDLPRTFEALRSGRTNEWRALLVARETVFLSAEHRAIVDEELAPRLEQLGDKRTEAGARKIAYRLDPRGFVNRSRAAANDRHVSIRPAPDAMTRLTALLPVAQGVACYAALARTADTTTAGGDERGRGQIMADTLVERVTGQASADDVSVTVNLVMSADTLLHTGTGTTASHDGNTERTAGDGDGDGDEQGNEPVHVDGYGPIPADIARELIRRPSPDTPMWIRRLFVHPASSELVAMETPQRRFTPGQRSFINLRDQWCRTPWCEAPIRHADHVVPAADGGATSTANAQGKCEGCNYAKEAPGWFDAVLENDEGRSEIETITPTGHRYRSTPPDPPGRKPDAA